MTSAAPAGDVVGRSLSADDGLVRAYQDRTPGSAASFEAARRVLPGFLAAVAGLARDRDVLFVLDEVQGLRNGPGDLDAAYQTAFTMVRPGA